jgi:hypothetical protein
MNMVPLIRISVVKMSNTEDIFPETDMIFYETDMVGLPKRVNGACKGPGLFPRELSLGSEEKGLLPFSRRHEYGVLSGILRLTGRYNCFLKRTKMFLRGVIKIRLYKKLPKKVLRSAILS